MYKLFLGRLPKSPPYFEGRFTNGFTWAEDFANYFYDKYYIDSKNYAYGGATTIWHPPKIKFIAPTTLLLELNQYLTDAMLQNKSDTLFSIWIGGNDYLFDQTNPNEMTTQVVNELVKTINTLYQLGAKHFLILNMPDLSQIPFAIENNIAASVSALCILHNQKLAAAIDNLKTKLPDAQIVYVNIYDTFVDVIKNPDKYNEKYHIHLTDTHNACWLGGFTKVQKHFQTSDWRNQFGNADISLVEHYVNDSPSLNIAHKVAQASEVGLEPCSDADEHLFWDAIHPTQVVHQIIAQIVEEKMFMS